MTSGEVAPPRSACTFPFRPHPPAAGKSGPGWARGKGAQEQGLAAMQNSQTFFWPHRIVQLALHWHSLIMQLIRLTGMRRRTTYTHKLTHIYTHAHTHAQAHALTQARTRTDTHAHARAHTHTQHTHTHTRTHTLSLAPSHTRALSHKNTHTLSLAITPKQHAKLARACSSSSSSDSKSAYSFERVWLLFFL